ncbi:ABC transporter permease [Catellatospora methionotrophica]|uniref:ABC transporter permease n=1 Tax=Catellatospora methionotrophica TaxID=121620 RepID=A0A8J3L4F6_9ACTN|nr:ABC transporter permease [Catellatospora methionotrophica]GIG14277.1 ABC transporter permease [Catellatospora methionotrophica]
MTAPASVYPVAVADLVDDFQAWAKELGDAPSHRATMKRFRIGTDKARALLSTLPTDTPDEPTTPAPDAAPVALLDPPAPVAPVLPEVTAEPITAPAELLYRVDVAAPPKITPPAAERVTPAHTTAPVAVPIPVPAPAPIAPAVRVRPKPRVRTWPILVVGLGAFIAIWAGWVELGRLTGFGVVHPLPGIWDSLKIDTAITLPLGMDAYAAFALKVWFTPDISARARKFARWSTIVSLLVGMCGQVAYHLMAAQGITSAPWQITTAVSCLPVIVLGLASGLVHLVRADQEADEQ